MGRNTYVRPTGPARGLTVYYWNGSAYVRDDDDRKLFVGDQDPKEVDVIVDGTTHEGWDEPKDLWEPLGGDLTEHFQAINANLTAFSNLGGAANKLPYFTGVGALAMTDFTLQARQLLDDTSFASMLTTLGAIAKAAFPIAIPIAVGDETTTITTGAGKTVFHMPFAMTVESVFASLNTVSSSGVVTFDIHEGAGAGTSILSTKLTIDASEETSLTAATAAVISDTALAAGARINIDIDEAGTGAKGPKVWLIGTRVIT